LGLCKTAARSRLPGLHRVALDDHGIYRVPSQMIARRHRMSVGTITADAMMHVSWLAGGRIGSIEESFIARLKPGDAFTSAAACCNWRGCRT